MKPIMLPIILVVILAFLGCADMTATQQRTVTGGAAGAAGGALIGAMAGNARPGRGDRRRCWRGGWFSLREARRVEATGVSTRSGRRTSHSVGSRDRGNNAVMRQGHGCRITCPQGTVATQPPKGACLYWGIFAQPCIAPGLHENPRRPVTSRAADHPKTSSPPPT